MSPSENIKLAEKNFQKDKDFAKAMHGKTTEGGGLSALTGKNQEA
ncbi:hypothetical protein JL09_g4891, partial [Pichia kudriavzevii]